MRVNTDNLKDRVARAKRGNNGEITSPKVLADLAMNNPNAFEAIVKSLK